MARWLDQGGPRAKGELRGKGTDLRTYAGLFSTLQKDNQGIIYRQKLSNKPVEDTRPCIHISLQKCIIQTCHEEGGHQGMAITIDYRGHPRTNTTGT